MNLRQCARRAPATVLALSLLLAGCVDPLRSGGELPAVLLPVGAAAASETTRSDPAEIVAAEVEGDRLALSLRFGGGCADHDFALIPSGEFREANPVQTTLTLAHDAHGDMCRALLSRELAFDLASVRAAFQRAYGAHGPLELHVREPGPAGRVHTLRYIF